MYENFEKFDMLKCYLESGQNANVASDLYLNRYPERRQPFVNIFQKLVNNLIRYGSFKKPRSKKYNRENRELLEITVLGEIQNNPNFSIRQMERQTGIPRTTANRILRSHKFKPYRVRRIHYLQPGDYNDRIIFCRWFLGKCRNNPAFSTNVIWTDEANISSAGIVNRYNEYNWSLENPHMTIERRVQGRYSFNVWVAIIGGRFIGPYIFDGPLRSPVYLQILENHIGEFIDDFPLIQRANTFFQQDGAPPHNAQIVSNYLSDLFGNNWMGNRGPIHWPPRSPDLTPLDFYLWGKIKDLTYRQNFNSRQELEGALRQAFNSITPLELLNSVNNVKSRCRLCLQENGGQFEHLL